MDKFIAKWGDHRSGGDPRLDSTKTPKEVDLVISEGYNKGITMLGIYELEGNTMRLCYDLQGKSRPTEFKSEPGTGRVLTVYLRTNPKEPSRNNLDVYLTVVLLFFGRSEVSTSNLFLTALKTDVDDKAGDAGRTYRPHVDKSSDPPTRRPSDPPTETTNSIGMTLKLIPAEEFMMGSPDDDKQAGGMKSPSTGCESPGPSIWGFTR